MNEKAIEELTQLLELTNLPWGIGRREPVLGEDKQKSKKLFYCYVGPETSRLTYLGKTMDEAVTRCISEYENGARNRGKK
jgi:hypothetical protein